MMHHALLHILPLESVSWRRCCFLITYTDILAEGCGTGLYHCLYVVWHAMSNRGSVIDNECDS